MSKLRVVAGMATAVILLAGCSSGKTATPVGSQIPPATIQSVVSQLDCKGYQTDPVTAPGSKTSGSCTLADGTDVQLYQMPSRAVGGYLIDIAKQMGVKKYWWRGNVLIVES